MHYIDMHYIDIALPINNGADGEYEFEQILTKITAQTMTVYNN